MTATELRDCLEALAWSQRGLARILDCDEAMVRKWARGVRPVPPEIATWLRALAAAHRRNPPPPDWRDRAAA